MNVAILCGHPDSHYARQVLRALNGCGLNRINLVAAEELRVSRSWQALWKQHQSRLPRVALQFLVSHLLLSLKGVWLSNPERVSSLEAEVKSQGGRFICVRNLNGEQCRKTLQELKVDVMILAGTPIIRSSILEVPRLGTLNAHQGALPRFRGMNVIEWSILERAIPTLTVHFVDPGVDTGDIIATAPIPLYPGDTLDKVRLRASAQQPELLAHTAAALISGSVARKSQRPEDGRQYFVMHPRLRVMAEQRLQERLQNSFSQSYSNTNGSDANKPTDSVLVERAS